MSGALVSPVEYEFTSLVQDLLDHTSSVIYVKDAEFRYLLINRQFETLFHLSRPEIVGKTDFDIFPRDLAEAFRANDRHVFESGEALQCEEVAPQDDGHHKYFSMKFPLRDASGSVYAIAGISTDITDRIRDRREIASLRSHQNMILDSVEDGICGLDVAGRVAFLNPAAERMLQWATADLQGLCHSQFLVNRNPNGRPTTAVDLNPIAAVLNGQTAKQVSAASFRRCDGSVIPVEYTVAPIHDVDTIIGAVVAFRDTTDRLRQLETEQEIQTAHRIQMSLNPKRMPTIPGFDFAAISVACSNACGDYFDFIPCGAGRLGVTVGDVSGHGLGAALEMVETRAILRTTMLTESDPVPCLTRLNQILSDDLPDDMFVSLFLAILNTDDRTLTYSAAGHDASILSANGELRRLESTGPVLGLSSSGMFSNGGTVALRAGDVLLIATDGIAETLSPTHELFGRARVIDLLRQHQSRSAAEIVAAIRDAAEAFRQLEPQRDDMTAVVLKIL